MTQGSGFLTKVHICSLLSNSSDKPVTSASIEYLKNLTQKSTGHRRARRVPVTNSWIQAKFHDLGNHQRDRLLAGISIEDAFNDYDIRDDEDACLLVSKFSKGSDLAFQVCSR